MYFSMGKPTEKAGDGSVKPGSARPVSWCWEVRGRMKDKGHEHPVIIIVIKITGNHGWEGGLCFARERSIQVAPPLPGN